MSLEKPEVVRTDTGAHDFLELVEMLDKELSERDGEEHEFFAQFNQLGKKDFAVVAYIDKFPAGCGALRSYGDDTFEVKRMFVRDEFRNRKIGAAILKSLEERMSELGGRYCILETGIRQPEAIRLYKREGYDVIPNFGQYTEVETSVCMKKDLGNG